MSNTNLSFWQLINKHRIEIPIIQRDYAQGRDNNKTKDIRKNFVRRIKKNFDTNTPLHLNFIYGKIRGLQSAKQKEANELATSKMLEAVKSYASNVNINFEYNLSQAESSDKTLHYTSFIPLDGQQRLTTLYLLHWYLAKQVDDDKLQVLSNFSYQIRPSSKDFCHSLIDAKFIINTDENISDIIKDATWFYSAWKKDPTVMGMLNMLDEIHRQFKEETDETLNSYWQALTNESNSLISFEFLNLEEYNLTDDLYIKMNARGKQLTEFENFKAWLIEFASSYNLMADWTTKLDTIWSEIFWLHKDEDSNQVDEELTRFFRNMAQVFYVKKNLTATNSPEDKKKIASQLATEKDKSTNEYIFISNDFYKENNLFDEDKLNKIFKVLEKISAQGYFQIEQSIEHLSFAKRIKHPFNAFISKDASMPDKVLFYGMAVYLLNHDIDTIENQKLFGQWMRVIRNLVQNSTIDEVSIFGRALRSIDELQTNCTTIYQYLFNNSKLKLGGFSDATIEEEIAKATLIFADPSWEEAMLPFENHEYFRGQINFLLQLSKVNDTTDKKLFIEYGQKSSIIFADKIKGGNENVLFEQALLTIDDYLIQVGRNWSFIRMETPSSKPLQDWRSQFLGDKIKLVLYKKLLDKISVDNSLQDLQEIVSQYNEVNWRTYFIKYPEAIRFCEKRFIRFYEDENIRILRNSALSHYHAELYSYCLFLDLGLRKESNKIDITPFTDLDYAEVKRGAEKPSVYFSGFNYRKNEYFLDIYFIPEENIYKIMLKILDEADARNLPVKPDNFPSIDNFNPKAKLFYSIDIKDKKAIPKKLSEIFESLKTL